ncbi:NAD(P)-binding domain-containing protein [Haloferula sp. A504]|uniref:NAD(P)-binding domain-containing protein n=1 Tax=Haloferula sp. A504 TaxID=3373601 RepID=UPI0031C34024|nr:NAD(P)-binding domain-containing protein [Verrucomicrobiaceae bacterium E54]
MKIGFIGTGKISAAVVEGLCRSRLEGLSIRVSPRNERTSAELARSHAAVRRCGDNQQVLDESDIVCLAVRPKDARRVLRELVFREDHRVVSFVTFLPLEDLASEAAPARNACRAIPLPTVAHRRCPIPLLNADDRVLEMFEAIGQPLRVEDEEQLHVLWALTGLISPLYDLLGQWSGWSTARGVGPDLTNRYVAEMVEALAFAARQQSPVRFDHLSEHAATPGGMNEQAAREIADSGSHAAWPEVLDHLLARFSEAEGAS